MVEYSPNGVPLVTGPWPTKDVSLEQGATVAMTDTKIDHLCRHHGRRDDTRIS